MAKLEALTTGQLLDRIFALYRKHFVLFFAIAIIPQLSRLILLAGPLARTSGSRPSVVAGVIGLAVWFVVFVALAAMSQGATTVAVSDIYLDKPASVKDSYSRVFHMTLRLVGMMFGYGLLVGVGFLLLIVPGVYFLLTYALATAVMAIENVSFSEAMTRSKDLVSGNRGRIAVIFLLSLVLQWAIGFGLGIPLALVNVKLIRTAPMLAQSLAQFVTMIASALAMPIGLIGFTLAYYDARVKKEAYDLEYMIESEEAATAAAAVGASAGTAGAAITGSSSFMLFDSETAAAPANPTPEPNSGENKQ